MTIEEVKIEEAIGLLKHHCSVCGTGLDTASNYCPYCGAEMEEEEE